MRKGPKVAAILLSLSLSRGKGGLGLSRERRDLGSLPCMLGSSDRDILPGIYRSCWLSGNCRSTPGVHAGSCGRLSC